MRIKMTGPQGPNSPAHRAIPINRASNPNRRISHTAAHKPNPAASQRHHPRCRCADAFNPGLLSPFTKTITPRDGAGRKHYCRALADGAITRAPT